MSRNILIPSQKLINISYSDIEETLYHFMYYGFTSHEICLKENYDYRSEILQNTTLGTRDQPYLFATIFKHFIYVCFQLLIFMY